MKRKAKKVAIVYDRVNKWGGAERVLLNLHEIFPDAPLYTSVYDKKSAPWAAIFPNINTSFLQWFPFARTNHEFLAPFMPFVFESFDFSAYDIVISVTSEAAKGINTKPGTLHICYCLTPTRYLWSHYENYFTSKILRILGSPIVAFLKKWDKIASKRPDIMIAISTEVKDRIKKYYNRKSIIIFPPSVSKIIKNPPKDKKYFLLVSRLVSYKKVDLAIKAFNTLAKPLIIVGIGRDALKLRKMARKNIKFVGHVSEKKLGEYYSGAKALILPQEEDFGIVSVEAQAFGVPVIAYKKGGAIDTVISGKTGIFFEHQKPQSLIDAVKRFEKTRFVVDNLYTNAQRFSKEIFRKELERLL